MRKFLLIFSLVLLAGIVAADFAASSFVESQAKGAVRTELQLSQDPDIDVRDFPFLLSVIRGHLGEVSATADNVQAEGVTFTEVTVDLFDTDVPHSLVLDGSGVITVDRVEGEAHIAEPEANRLLQQQAPGVTFRLGAGTVQIEVTREVLGQALQISLTGTPSLEGDVIRFQPTAVDAGVPLPPEVEQAVLNQAFLLAVPPLPAGLTVTRIEVQPGELVLFAEVGPVQFQT